MRTCELIQNCILRLALRLHIRTMSRIVGMFRYSLRMSSKKWEDVFILYTNELQRDWEPRIPQSSLNRKPPIHVLQACHDLEEAIKRNPQLLAQFDEEVADDELTSSIHVGIARLVVFRWIRVKDDAIVVHPLSK